MKRRVWPQEPARVVCRTTCSGEDACEVLTPGANDRRAGGAFEMNIPRGVKLGFHASSPKMIQGGGKIVSRGNYGIGVDSKQPRAGYGNTLCHAPCYSPLLKLPTEGRHFFPFSSPSSRVVLTVATSRSLHPVALRIIRSCTCVCCSNRGLGTLSRGRVSREK